MTFWLNRNINKLNWRVILNMIGFALIALSGLLMLPVIVALRYREFHLLSPFLITIGVCALCGLFLSRLKVKRNAYFAHDGMIAVGLVWICVSFFGCLPFYFSGQIPALVDCFFETVSGFTTTGATILTDIESLSKSLLFWRSFTHWIGGMGVLVFVLAFLPKNNEHTMHIMRAEVPGPTISKLVSRLKTTAMILYALYMALSVIELLFLLAGGMPLFDALCNTFGTAGTGGFAIYGASIGAYGSVYFEVVITVFMFLFGINFNLYFFLILRDFKPILKNEELRWYIGIVALSIVAITINILPLYHTLAESLRYSSFQVVSIITTTGYATADFNLWPTLSKMILFFLMVVGACAGSTGGGLKVTRLMIVLKKIKLNVQKLWHPHKVEAIMVDGKIVDKETVDQVMAFFGAWMILIAAATLVVALDDFDFETTLTAVYTCLGNVGPGLGLCGPTGSFALFSALSKIVLSLCMLLGRLEIYPILIFLFPLLEIDKRKPVLRRRRED